MICQHSTKICFLTILCAVPGLLAAVPEPQHVRVTSLNLGVVLEWDAPPHSSPANITYTAQYRPTFRPDFVTVCGNQTEEGCDFTDSQHNRDIRVPREGGASRRDLPVGGDFGIQQRQRHPDWSPHSEAVLQGVDHGGAHHRACAESQGNIRLLGLQIRY
ncbi:hypothetical protein AAFF_G00230550 [Aldrovandia affinis]|uniref:Fibronectin type-III domain-containing protein n=1 Tax=Aldrovandia affinis TaxID=143900 RepID=A0AAD7RFL4_9TELE|nr:hypothetical protein AAFF_G00230550 [Aldrovandia affinis]